MMEIQEYLIIVGIAMGMVLAVIGSVFIVLYRSRGLYQIERPIDIPEGDFQ